MSNRHPAAQEDDTMSGLYTMKDEDKVMICAALGIEEMPFEAVIAIENIVHEYQGSGDKSAVHPAMIIAHKNVADRWKRIRGKRALNETSGEGE